MIVTLKHKMPDGNFEEKQVEIEGFPTPRIIHDNGRMYLNTIDMRIYHSVPWGQVDLNSSIVKLKGDGNGKTSSYI